MSQDCPPEKVFLLVNGSKLKNISELISFLKTNDDATFSYHVNKDKNDFGNWLRDVFNKKKLADKLDKVKDKSQYMKILVDYINNDTPKKKINSQLPKKPKLPNQSNTKTFKHKLKTANKNSLSNKVKKLGQKIQKIEEKYKRLHKP